MSKRTFYIYIHIMTPVRNMIFPMYFHSCVRCNNIYFHWHLHIPRSCLTTAQILEWVVLLLPLCQSLFFLVVVIPLRVFVIIYIMYV